MPAGQAWLALAFNIQILFDFAGYSDIAIGLGLLFGVQLPFNFNAPFRSTNIQDFWQRWHMTLMRFLRDYVFHPLANSRIVPRRFLLVQYFAAMLVTMALCGLWHGANWTFVLWGVLHGVALIICSLWRRYCPRLPQLVGWALTMGFVLLTGVIFRAGTLDAALHIYQGLEILARPQPGQAFVADLDCRADCLPGAGESGHRGMADAAAQYMDGGAIGRRAAGDAHSDRRSVGQ